MSKIKLYSQPDGGGAPVRTEMATLTGNQQCYWLPDSPSTPRDAVFLDDRVVLSVKWGSLLSTADEDGLIRLVLDGTTIGGYYAAHNPVNGQWTLKVDITYLLKSYAEPFDIWGNHGEPYSEPNSGMRTYTPRTLSLYTENTQSVSASDEIIILEGKSLVEMPHPLYEEIQNIDTTYIDSVFNRARVFPPNVILRAGEDHYQTYFITNDIWVECPAEEMYECNADYSLSDTPILFFGNTYGNGNGGCICPQFTNTKGFGFKGKLGNYVIPYTRIGEHPCKEYVVVRWRSCTGNYRQHIFECRNITSNLDSSTKTDPMGTEFRNLVTGSYQFDIHLSGLTRYSLWYYQDILTSEEIWCAPYIWGEPFSDFVGNGTAIETRVDEQYACSVVSPKKYTLPNGNASKFYDFDCTLKYKATSL